MPRRFLIVVSLLVAVAARGSAPPAVAASKRLSVVVLDLDANSRAQDAAPGATSLLASKLAAAKELAVLSQRDVATVLGLERQRQLLGAGCGEGSCYAEISGALGASYVVSGRLDRLGDALVLNVTLYDSRRGVALAKPSVQVAGVEELPIAVEKVAGEIHRALEVRAPPTAAPATGGRRGFVLGMKVGNQFLLSLTALSPGGDIDLGYRFDEEWVAFLQLGFNAVFAGEGDRTAQLSLFPSAVGARKLYRVDRAFQPYWALGLGLQLSIGDFALVTDTQGFPTVLGMAGFHYMLNKHLGLTVDASTNVAQTLLGFRRHPGESNVGAGLNFDLSVGFTYRF